MINTFLFTNRNICQLNLWQPVLCSLIVACVSVCACVCSSPTFWFTFLMGTVKKNVVIIKVKFNIRCNLAVLSRPLLSKKKEIIVVQKKILEIIQWATLLLTRFSSAHTNTLRLIWFYFHSPDAPHSYWSTKCGLIQC